MYRVKDQNGKTKYAGRSKATVLDNRDPQDRGRIQITHPVLGNTAWVEYLHTPGHFTVPSIGDVVYVECDAGEPEFPYCWGNIVKGTDDAPELPSAFRRDIPTNRGIYSPDGHLIEVDDGEYELTSDKNNPTKTTKNKGIRITTSDGSKVHILDDTDNGTRQILLEDPDGNKIVIDRENKSMDLSIDGDYNVTATGTGKIVAGTSVTIDTPDTSITGTASVDGDTTLNANLQVTGNSQLAGGTPLVLATAQFIGTGNVGAPVISNIMSGQSTKVTSS